ncbi:MAG: glycosyltransferase family 4 protein, partial [Candidatus Thorarchaeota archaeon]
SDSFTRERRSEELRNKLGLNGKTVVISLRTLEPLYDVESLIRAAPLVIEKNPNMHFVILGGGPLREELEQLSNDLGMADNITFIGRIPLAEMPVYLASSDIYVSTSLSDAGLAASTGEAMACERPVVVTDDPDNRLWIEDGVNGFIVPVTNPLALAEKILVLAGDEELRRDFGERSRKIIAERNDYNQEMGKVLAMYEKVIAEYSQSTSTEK